MQRGHGWRHWCKIAVRSHFEVIETKIVIIALERYTVCSDPKCNDQALYPGGFFEDEITQFLRDRYWASNVLVVPKPWEKMLSERRVMISPEVLEGVVPGGDDAFRVAQALGQRAEAVRRT